ncbi:5-amino-6-(5-phosphoribosylamino)uracil reductase [Agromyces badenianii]|uniref:5-amino-6-(5-phosphoribosylamino)uracil reductase n=1 Tax=Agromyces badenianii TaxID=2080742 RepID=A0A2S0WSK4_9MICO|nr:dihydrofolate reductase family protein [Agromyces badenianii]AWB94325.1 5-amino-6-(5-phosphoribosylamino)uracil reductase [Agromyces badenianii]
MTLDDGLVTANLTISLDGFVAGPHQSLDDPLGEGGEDMHRWMFEQPDENQSIVDQILAPSAYIMGRNMFGPIRGEWPDDEWKGWWGDDPPYHGPVFVLTHHARDPIPMQGGTTFHFVTTGIDDALARAKAAAGTGRVSIAGGASTVRQYLAAGRIDRIILSIAPIMLGDGERLFDGLHVEMTPVEVLNTELATHITYDVRH